MPSRHVRALSGQQADLSTATPRWVCASEQLWDAVSSHLPSHPEQPHGPAGSGATRQPGVPVTQMERETARSTRCPLRAAISHCCQKQRPHTPHGSPCSPTTERFPKAALPSTDSSELTGTPMAGAEATGSCLPCCVAAHPLSVLPAPRGEAGSGSAPVVSEA